MTNEPTGLVNDEQVVVFLHDPAGEIGQIDQGGFFAVGIVHDLMENE
jgi:hypothetical protein